MIRMGTNQRGVVVVWVNENQTIRHKSLRISLRGFLTEPLTELGVGATHQYSLYPLCLFLNKECPQKMQIDSKVVRTHQFFQSEEESESDKSKGSNVVITTHQFLPPLLPPALSLRLKKHIWNISKCHQMTYFLFKFLVPNLKKFSFSFLFIAIWRGIFSFPFGNIVSREACPT